MNGTNGNSPDETSTAHSRLSSLTPEQLVHINLCCDQYERLWRDQGTASLADFLQRTTANRIDALHEALVQELVLIDIELRQRNGLQQTAEYYLEACATLNRVWLDEQLAHSMAQGSQTEANELANGQLIGDYVILEPLGAGGMGSVYRAEHVLMKRPVALKIIQRQYQSNPLLQRRFEREVRTLAKLSHPNVVTAFDARQDSGWLYLVTELIEGRDLGKLVREKGPLSPVKAAHYAWQAANGLHYAHSQGIVHRDIKPENLFLDQSQKIKVLDLGLARLSASDFEHADRAGLTESSQVLGTAAYISPEQARAAATADHRSDIYSLGCTLFFLLTGRPPYVGDSLVATIIAHVSEPVPSVVQPSNRQPIPPQLDALVQSMMAKNPNDRPKSMSVVVAELAAIIKQLQTTAQTSTAQTSTAQASTVQASTSTKMPTQPLESDPVTGYPKVNTTPWRLRSAIGRRKFLWGSLIAAPVITFATYRAFQFLFRGSNGNQAPEKSLSTLS
ncbi:MAG: serine/threonine-protein kinase, partial [Pirellulaceae bacterium]|nr:serine/threonine-protein kinase [Pirellulaceae bacterium]